MKKFSALKRYQQLQEMLSEVYNGDTEFDLDELANDFAFVENGENNTVVRFIPMEGDYVFVSDFDGQTRLKMNFESLSEEAKTHTLRCMTKALVILEIKNHML